MVDEVVNLLNEINLKLEVIEKKKNMPHLIYAKEIAQNYSVNLNKATEFCKMIWN